MSRAYRLAKEGSWILVGQIASVVGSLVLVRVLTGYLEPSEYGQLALGLTFASLINQLVMVGLIAGAGRFYSIAIEEGDFDGYVKGITQLLGIAAFVIVVISFFLILFLHWFDYSKWIGLVVAALVFSIFSGCSSALNAIQVAARQRLTAAVLISMDAFLKIIVVTGVIHLFGASGTAVIIGYGLASLVMLVLQTSSLRFLCIKNQGKNTVGTDWWRLIWLYAMPFSVWGIFTWAQQASDRWALQILGGAHDVGLYAVIFQLGYVPIGVGTSFMTSFLAPILYKRSGLALDHAKNVSVHNTTLFFSKVAIATTVLAFIGALLLHRWIFKLLVSEEYQPISYLLPWMILAGGNFAAGQILALKLMSEMRVKNMLSVKVITAIFSVIMCFSGAFFYGVGGVVGAMVLFSFFYLSWMLHLTRHPPKNIQ
jgi:O-antigen/teichoic acid export membrane protein